MIEYANESLAMVPPTWAPWVTPHVGEGEEAEREGAIAIDRRLRERAAAMARNDYELGILLRRGFVMKVHELGGFASFHEYAHRLFGFSGRQTEERLRVAEALDRLPGLSVELAQGRVCWSVVRELTRVATEETEPEWIAAADGKIAREVEAMVSGRTLGDTPSDPARPEARMFRISMRVSASTYALWEEARRVLTAEGEGALDDDELLASVARAVLGGPRDAGRSNYQIAINQCDACGCATQRAGATHVSIDDADLETARCDAQHVGHVDGSEPERAKQEIPPSVRRAVIARHEHRCAVPGCRHAAYLDVHHTRLRSEGGTHDPEYLVALCSTHHRMTHVGKLVVRGSFTSGLVFEHADGRAYGSNEVDSAAADRFAEVFAALCILGFKEREARAHIDAARPLVGEDLSKEAAPRGAAPDPCERGRVDGPRGTRRVRASDRRDVPAGFPHVGPERWTAILRSTRSRRAPT
jgi:hypothetical protein